MNNNPITPAQLRVLNFIKDHSLLVGMPPTRQEIADHFKWKSANAAEDHLMRLEQKGYVEIVRGKSRSIFIVPEEVRLEAKI